MAWDQLGNLQQLVELFIKKVTHRWAHCVRTSSPTLQSDLLSDELFAAELNRLLNHNDAPERKDELIRLVKDLLAAYMKTMTDREDRPKQDQPRPKQDQSRPKVADSRRLRLALPVGVIPRSREGPMTGTDTTQDIRRRTLHRSARRSVLP